MLLIDNATVEQVLSMEDCIASQEQAFRGLLTGDAVNRQPAGLVQLAHPVLPRLSALVAGDVGRLERAGHRHDLGQVGTPFAQERLEPRHRGQLAGGGDAVPARSQPEAGDRSQSRTYCLSKLGWARPGDH